MVISDLLYTSCQMRGDFANTKNRIKYSNNANETECPQPPSPALFLSRCLSYPNYRSRDIQFRLGDTDFASDVTLGRCMPNSSRTRHVGGRCRKRLWGIVSETQSQ